jgi:hypothetical protein
MRLRVEIHRVLRPGGTAILATPNNERWRALISLMVRGHFGGFSRSGKDINLTALVRSDFEKLLQFAGFLEISFDYATCGMILKLPVSRQTPGGRLRGVRYSDKLVIVCRKS